MMNRIAEVLLDRALAGDREAQRRIRELRHRVRDRELGEELCCALKDRAPLVVGHVPAACWAEAVVLEGDPEQLIGVSAPFPYRLHLRGVAVCMDACRRWWISLLLTVDGVPTAVLRRGGREGHDYEQTLVPRCRAREWRRALAMQPPPTWLALHPGPLASLYSLAGSEPAQDVYIRPGASVGETLRGLAWEPWEGWAPGNAIALHQLDLTRWAHPAAI